MSGLTTARSALAHAKSRAAERGLRGAALATYLGPYKMAAKGKKIPQRLQRVKETKKSQAVRVKINRIQWSLQSFRRPGRTPNPEP